MSDVDLTAEFFPIFREEPTDDKRAQKRSLANYFEQALHIEECARAVKRFKCNGSVHGHKILDNAAAVEALVDKAPPEMAEAIRKSKVTVFEKTQVLDQVLRRRYEMKKDGKLTGNLSKRLQQRIAATQTPAAQ